MTVRPGVATGAGAGPEVGVVSLATRDLDTAHRYIGEVYTPHRLVFRGPREVDLRLGYAESPRLTVGRMGYGADVRVEVPPPESCYHLALPVRGACAVEQGRARVEADARARAAMMSAADPLSVQWSPDAVAYILKITRSSLEQHLARMLGHPVRGPIRFALDFDLTRAGAQALRSSVEFLWAELARPGGIAAVPMAREQLERCILTQLLSVVPHPWTPVLEARVTAPSGTVPRVIEFIEAHPDQDLSTTRLAAWAGVSERALQVGFRKTLDTTPGAYVRSVRLERVHADLQAGPHRATIAEVAARWGFFHPSRFARQYRQRFGVLPSQTVPR